MKFRAILTATFVVVAAPAFAQNYVEVYQKGNQNWFAGNQFGGRNNTAIVGQQGVGANVSSYAAFAQEGRRNTIVVQQDATIPGSRAELRVGGTQTGYLNSFTASQTLLDGLNSASVTQTRLSRRR